MSKLRFAIVIQVNSLKRQGVHFMLQGHMILGMLVSNSSYNHIIIGSLVGFLWKSKGLDLT